MKNPLRKRFLRELKQDFGKYAVIFLFITLTIGFISGFLVADNRPMHMMKALKNTILKTAILNWNKRQMRHCLKK